MEYSRKLLISKILISLAMAIYSTLPLLAQVDWHFTANLLAFPVLMYALWGKLHGTGRSVRLVAFLGMAYCVGYFVSVAWGGNKASPDNLPLFVMIFVLLTLGVLFSIKRGKNSD